MHFRLIQEVVDVRDVDMPLIFSRVAHRVEQVGLLRVEALSCALHQQLSLLVVLLDVDENAGRLGFLHFRR